MSKTTKTTPDDEYDSPWKAALEEYFPESMALLFPHIYADIDWEAGYEFLDKELEKINRHGQVPSQAVDKLVRVKRLSGEVLWVLLHIDVQSQHETQFDKRLFQYNYRLFDRYDQPIVTVIIYGDTSTKWRPQSYERELWGFKVKMEFPTVKLIEYNVTELEQSDNPFAVVVLAHLYTKSTKHQPEQRFDFKWRLIRMLFERGYSRDRILSLFRYIDWLMALPEGLDKKLLETIAEHEETQDMTFMILPERIGYKRGLEEGIEQGIEQGRAEGEQKRLETAREDVIEVLQIRFGALPSALTESITALEDFTLLKTLHRTAVTIESVPRFEAFLRAQQTGQSN